MRLIALGISLCVALISNVVRAENAMRVAGVFAVGKDGQAAYTVPINIPTLPEELGISLALGYNSQGGPNHAGRGWGIAGLSMITRCPLTVAQDGVSDPLLDSLDPTYCLDGQRLILDPATAASSTRRYNQEFEKFARITASVLPTVGKQISSFKVETKSGIILSYSAVETPFGEKWWWPLTAIRNRYGTAFLIDYKLHANLPRPDIIKKESVDDAPMEVLVKFMYLAVPDTAWPNSYLDALHMYRQSYLSAIEIYKVPSRTTLLKQYKFTYAIDPATRVPNLSSLQECTETCLPALQFNYASEIPRFTPMIASAVLDWGNSEGREWVDMNGDGKADFCRIVGAAGATRAACTVSTGTGFGDTLASSLLDAGVDGSQKWVDVNADGFADFCRVTGVPGAYSLTCTLGAATGFGSTVSSAIDPGNEMLNAKWHDIKNDGKLRYCRYDSTSQFRCAVLSGGVFVEEAGLTGTGSGKFDMVNLIAKAAPYRCSRQPLKLSCAMLDGSKQFDIVISGNPGWWADVNGDGHSDYCEVTGTLSTSAMQCGRSKDRKGAQATAYIEHLGAVPGPNVTAGLTTKAKWVDINGDKAADYCRLIGGPSSYKAACSVHDGPAFRDAIESDILDPGQENGQDWVDVRGDNGKAFCRLIGSVNLVDSRAACTPLAPPGGQLTRIDNGIGSSLKISYKPITDSSVYTKGTNAVYPVLDVQEPAYVVSQTDLGNGRGGYVSTSYKYGAAVRDLTGRGGLGVRWMESTSLAKRIVTRTVYRQDFPFAGLAQQTTVALAGRGNSGLLSDVTYEYGCKDFVSVSGCTVAQGARYFPYLSTTVSHSWDLNGAALPVITTSQEVDSLGNVTRSKRLASDDIMVETINTYKTSPQQHWLPGLLEKSIITKSAPVN